MKIYPLRRKRRELGLTQRALSELSGVPIRTIQNWEQGKAVPTVFEFREVARALGCSMDDLVP